VDEILKYISVITVAGAGISFVVGLWKYLDQRAREELTKRFEIYHDLMRRVSAVGETAGTGLPLTQQLAAIYELQHFKDYKFASLPILDHLREYYGKMNISPSSRALLAAIDKTMQDLQH
jgi:hypothetical protein